MVCPDQIDFRKDCGTSERGGEVLDVRDWITIRNRATVQLSVIASLQEFSSGPCEVVMTSCWRKAV